MSLYRDQVLPRLTDVALGGEEFARIRAGPIDRPIGDAGFRMDRLDTSYMSGPKPFGYLFEGVAGKTA